MMHRQKHGGYPPNRPPDGREWPRGGQIHANHTQKSGKSFLTRRFDPKNVKFEMAAPEPGLAGCAVGGGRRAPGGGRRAAGAGRRAPGAGRYAQSLKPLPPPHTTHTHTHTQDCYPALREDKRKLRFAHSRSARGPFGLPNKGRPWALLGPRAPNKAARTTWRRQASLVGTVVPRRDVLFSGKNDPPPIFDLGL